MARCVRGRTGDSEFLFSSQEIIDGDVASGFVECRQQIFPGVSGVSLPAFPEIVVGFQQGVGIGEMCRQHEFQPSQRVVQPADEQQASAFF